MRTYARPRIMNIRGFTLLEIVTVVAIVAIIATIAWPSFEGQIKRMERRDGVTALTSASHSLSLYKGDYGGYTNCTLVPAPAHSPYGLYAYNNSGAATNLTSPNNHYSITLQVPDPGSADPESYLLTASNNAPIDDPECTALTLDNRGIKSCTGTASPNKCHTCWGE